MLADSMVHTNAAQVEPPGQRNSRHQVQRISAVNDHRSLGAVAGELADLLEQQSTFLRQLGMPGVANEACREVRQLRLLVALGG